MRAIFRLCGLVLLTAAAAQAQLVASVKLAKKQYVAGEAVKAVVTLTNNAGQDLVFRGGREPWLDFMVKRGDGEPCTPVASLNLPPLRLGSGETVAKEINLSAAYSLIDMGSYSVYATVRSPGSATAGFASNRVLFNVVTARPYWAQKVSVRGDASKVREFRVLQFSGDQKTQLYLQVMDGRLGLPLRTFPLGDALMFRKPQMTVDANQHLHVFFLTTPALWSHVEVDVNGNVVTSAYHQRAGSSDPVLVIQAGAVHVANSVIYDPKAIAAERAKTRKASERPVIVPQQ